MNKKNAEKTTFKILNDKIVIYTSKKDWWERQLSYSVDDLSEFQGNVKRTQKRLNSFNISNIERVEGTGYFKKKCAEWKKEMTSSVNKHTPKFSWKNLTVSETMGLIIKWLGVIGIAIFFLSVIYIYPYPFEISNGIFTTIIKLILASIVIVFMRSFIIDTYNNHILKKRKETFFKNTKGKIFDDNTGFEIIDTYVLISGYEQQKKIHRKLSRLSTLKNVFIVFVAFPIQILTFIYNSISKYLANTEIKQPTWSFQIPDNQPQPTKNIKTTPFQKPKKSGLIRPETLQEWEMLIQQAEKEDDTIID